MRNKNVIKPIGIKLFEDREENINFAIGNIILTVYILYLVVDSITILDSNLVKWIYDIPMDKIIFNPYFIRSVAYAFIILFFTLSFYTFTNRSIKFRIYIIISNLIIIGVNVSDIIINLANNNQIGIYFVKSIFIIFISIIMSIYIIRSKKVEKIFCK